MGKPQGGTQPTNIGQTALGQYVNLRTSIQGDKRSVEMKITKIANDNNVNALWKSLPLEVKEMIENSKYGETPETKSQFLLNWIGDADGLIRWSYETLQPYDQDRM